MSHKSEELYSIDFYAYNSNINNWNSTFKFAFSFITLFICILSNNYYVSLAVFFSMSGFTILIGGLKLKNYLRLLLIPFLFIAVSTIAIAIGFTNKPLEGQINISIPFIYLYFSQKSIFSAFNVLLKALGAVSSMYMLILSTPASEFISVLRKLHIPKLIAELMNMIYRFIFILIEVQYKMKCSAKSRLGYCNLKNSFYSFGYIAGNLFFISLKKANIYYDAMLSRCYCGDFYFLEEEKPIKPIQISCAIIYWIFLIILWLII